MIRNLVAAIGMGATLLGTAPAGAAPATATSTTPHPVVELRQYKLVEGARDAFVDLFDRTFVESQEATGMRLIGQFRDHDRGDRFTWIREFPDMDARGKALNDFYFGPVWQAHRATANPMLDDNDNVLLLRPARNGSGFGPSAVRAAPGEPPTMGGLVFVTIEYLWKDPNDGFSAFFLDDVAPALRDAGLPVLGTFVPEEATNNFPRLIVRQGEKILVWVTKAASIEDYEKAMAKLHASTHWCDAVAARLADFEERPAQVLRLDPTPRSALR